MADRAMTAKVVRAQQQRREAAYNEFTKPYYLMQPSKRELRALLGSFDGVMVRRIPSEPRRH
jgi:hypothetical protein